MQSLIVIYRDNCHDGITALWAVKQALPDAEPYPGRYNEAPDLERLRGRHVVFVDFCWKLDVMRDVADVAMSMLVLDHYASAAKDLLESPKWFFGTGYGNGPCPRRAPIVDLSKNELRVTWERHLANSAYDRRVNAINCGAPIYCLFDMERSGAGIAWDVFHPGKPRPSLVDYVEDRDLWRFKLPASREVHAWCGSYPLTLEAREKLVHQMVGEGVGYGNKDVSDWPSARTGAAILRYHDRLVADVVRVALTEEIGGHVVPSVSCPNLALAPDVGQELAKGQPFAAVWHDRPDGTRYVSLRSDEDGLDVSEVAAKYGGGGHKHAAGFTRTMVVKLVLPAESVEHLSELAAAPPNAAPALVDAFRAARTADAERELLKAAKRIEPVKRLVEERDALRRDLAAQQRVMDDHQRYANELLARARSAEMERDELRERLDVLIMRGGQ